jgi:hypothetical protein
VSHAEAQSSKGYGGCRTRSRPTEAASLFLPEAAWGRQPGQGAMNHVCDVTDIEFNRQPCTQTAVDVMIVQTGCNT